METVVKVKPLRGVIIITLAACLTIALAPWFSGGQEPVAMVISGGAVLLAALLLWRQPEVRLLQRGPLVWSWWVIIGWAVLSLIWSANRYSSIVWVLQWVTAGAAFWIAYVMATERRAREVVITLYLLTAGVFALGAIWMFMTGDYGRLTGTFYWANPAAAYLMPAILLTVDRVRRSQGRRMWGWGAAAIGFMAAFWLTDSRAGAIVMALILGLYCFVSKPKRGFWTKFVFVMLCGYGLCLGLSYVSTFSAHHSATILPGSRFSEAALGESQSMSDRVMYVLSAVQIWADHPLTGTGAGTFGDVHPRYQIRVVSASSNVHNVYVQTAAELGLVGVLALLSLLVWLFAGILRGLTANPDLLPVALGVAALLLHFGLDIDASYPSLLILAAVLMGLVYRQWGEVWGKASWRLALVAAVILVPAASLYRSETWSTAAASYQDADDYLGAAAHLAEATSGLAYNPDILSAEGIAWYTMAAGGEKGSLAAAQKALQLAQEAESQDPDDGQHHQLEGRVLAIEGKYKQAARAFQEALKLDPYNHPEYALDLATVQQDLGQHDEAETTVQSMLSQYPEEVVANRSSDATLRPALADLEAFLGNIYLQEQDLGDAGYAAKQSLHFDSASLRGRALSHQVQIRQQNKGSGI